MLEPYEPSQALKTSGSGLLKAPRVRTKHEEAAFQFSVAKVWNSLLYYVIQAYSVAMLKTRVTSILFGRAYGG